MDAAKAAQLSNAWAQWRKDNVAARDVTTLGGGTRQNEFLENRLWHAFMGGAAARDAMIEAELRSTTNGLNPEP